MNSVSSKYKLSKAISSLVLCACAATAFAGQSELQPLSWPVVEANETASDDALALKSVFEQIKSLETKIEDEQKAIAGAYSPVSGDHVKSDAKEQTGKAFEDILAVINTYHTMKLPALSNKNAQRHMLAAVQSNEKRAVMIAAKCAAIANPNTDNYQLNSLDKQIHDLKAREAISVKSAYQSLHAQEQTF